jgi:hypothetical protein
MRGLAGRVESLTGTARSALSNLGHRTDVLCDAGRAVGGLADVASHLARGSTLLFHGAGDGIGDIVNLANDAADRSIAATASRVSDWIDSTRRATRYARQPPRAVMSRVVRRRDVRTGAFDPVAALELEVAMQSGWATWVRVTRRREAHRQGVGPAPHLPERIPSGACGSAWPFHPRLQVQASRAAPGARDTRVR